MLGESDKLDFVNTILRRKESSIRYIRQRCNEKQLMYIEDIFQEVIRVALHRKMDVTTRSLELCLFSAYSYVFRTGMFKQLSFEPSQDDLSLLSCSDNSSLEFADSPESDLLDREEKKNWIKAVASAFLARKKSRDCMIAIFRLEGRTLQSIGDVLGLTRERVRQIESEVFESIDLNLSKIESGKCDFVHMWSLFDDFYSESYLDHLFFSKTFDGISTLILYHNFIVSMNDEIPKNRKIMSVSSFFSVPNSLFTVSIEPESNGMFSCEISYRYDLMWTAHQTSYGTWICINDFSEEFEYDTFEQFLFDTIYDYLSESLLDEQYQESFNFIEGKVAETFAVVC